MTKCDYIVTTVLRRNVNVLVDQTASTRKWADSFTLPTPIQSYRITLYLFHSPLEDFEQLKIIGVGIVWGDTN